MLEPIPKSQLKAWLTEHGYESPTKIEGLYKAPTPYDDVIEQIKHQISVDPNWIGLVNGRRGAGKTGHLPLTIQGKKVTHILIDEITHEDPPDHP